MRRTALRRWSQKRGPWLSRYRASEQKRIIAQGGVKTGRKAHTPTAASRMMMGGIQCEAAMLGKCGGSVQREHIFNRQVRGVGGCNCRINMICLCFQHHILGKHARGRETFYRQHPDLLDRLEAAREHHRLRHLPNSPLPCAPKHTRREGSFGDSES